MSDYGVVPSGVKVQPKPFKAAVPEETVAEFKQLLRLSKVGPATYENQLQDRRYGVNRDWFIKAKKHWETDYDWRTCEREINSFPNFTSSVKDEHGHEFSIHFIALFSQKKDAIPVVFLHGWPGSILEFLSLLSVVKKQYTPDTLPYNIVVPSLPGYAFSSTPPLDRDFERKDIAPVINQLMIDLGFGSGYVAQGGDIGSFVSRQLAVEAKECKGESRTDAFHLNFNRINPPENADKLPLTDLEKKSQPRGEAFQKTGSAYAIEHGTRTATIGLTLSASPLALLAWIGEKFLEWTDEDPALDTILDSVTLYWLTETYPRCIYPYRGGFGDKVNVNDWNVKSPKIYTEKPQGCSWFPKEIIPTPISWIKETGNVVHHRQHESGGHFAAMEKPEALWADVEEFLKVAWNEGASKL